MAVGKPIKLFASPRFRAPLRIAVTFLIISYFYLYSSDWLVDVLVPTHWQFAVNVSKGFIYVTLVAIGLVYFIHDALAQMQVAEERYKQLFDASPDGIAVVALNGHIESANPALSKILGWSEEELVEIQPGELFDIISPKAAKIVALQNERGEQRERVIMHSKDGTEIPVLLTLKTFTLASGEDRICAIVHELSEMEKHEAKYREGERQRLVGHLAGGVAHDFNNLLTVISGNTEILLDLAKPDTPQHRASNTIWMAGQQAAQLVRQLLAFARRQPLDPAPFSVTDRLTELMPLLEKAVGAHVNLELKFDDNTWEAYADASQFENAVLNLVLNAKDALRDDRTILVEANNIEVGPNSRLKDVLVPGEYVELSVTDSGTGMEEDVVQRAIEPFFTTKESGHGIGLGLSTVFGFAKQSGGHLKIRSTPEQGTVVTFYLPRPMAPRRHRTDIVDDDEVIGGNERILVVEGDALVRVFLDNALSQLGYRVVAVSNIEEAMALLGTHSEIDLLITNVGLDSGISRSAFEEEIQNSHPSLAVLFISDPVAQQASGDEGGISTVSRPIQVEDLARQIRKTLKRT